MITKCFRKDSFGKEEIYIDGEILTGTWDVFYSYNELRENMNESYITETLSLMMSELYLDNRFICIGDTVWYPYSGGTIRKITDAISYKALCDDVEKMDKDEKLHMRVQGPFDVLPKVIAVDFDGCLCENKYPEIGSLNYDIINKLKVEQSKGTVVILWTCREYILLEQALDILEKEAGFIPDYANENCPEWVMRYGTATRKIGANEYWDDKAVQITAERKMK